MQQLQQPAVTTVAHTLTGSNSTFVLVSIYGVQVHFQATPSFMSTFVSSQMTAGVKLSSVEGGSSLTCLLMRRTNLNSIDDVDDDKCAELLIKVETFLYRLKIDVIYM